MNCFTLLDGGTFFPSHFEAYLRVQFGLFFFGLNFMFMRVIMSCHVLFVFLFFKFMFMFPCPRCVYVAFDKIWTFGRFLRFAFGPNPQTTPFPASCSCSVFVKTSNVILSANQLGQTLSQAPGHGYHQWVSTSRRTPWKKGTRGEGDGDCGKEHFFNIQLMLSPNFTTTFQLIDSGLDNSFALVYAGF